MPGHRWRQGIKGIGDVRRDSMYRWEKDSVTFSGNSAMFGHSGKKGAHRHESLLVWISVRPNRQWAVFYNEHNRRGPRWRRYDVRNLTPDGKRIEESQQSVEREREEETKRTRSRRRASLRDVGDRRWSRNRYRRDAIIWYLDDEVIITKAPRLPPSWKFHGDMDAAKLYQRR